MGSKPLTQRNSSKDKNHNEVVKALRLAGYAVSETHMVGNGFPDLVVGIPRPDGSPGVNLLLEIKSKANWSLSDKQLQFFAEWPGMIAVAASPDEAVRLCNEIRIKLVDGFEPTTY
jgi:hypothetical protein